MALSMFKNASNQKTDTTLKTETRCNLRIFLDQATELYILKSWFFKVASVFWFDPFLNMLSTLWWIFQKRGLHFWISFDQRNLVYTLECISKGFSHGHQDQNLNALWTRGAVELISLCSCFPITKLRHYLS